MADEARIGAIVGGKYRLLRRLGAGGMGAVYEAVNTWTERRVALKLMRPDLSQDPALVQRFLREARIATKLAHPHIVEVLDMGQDPEDGALFLVQELLHGRDLRSLLDERRTLSLQQAYELLVPIASALVAAQGQLVVHRDLKPENIFLVERPSGVVPKLIDFGIARQAEEASGERSLTRTGAAMGTPYYMSPEQARGARDIDGQTDVWSLGAVFFEALSGRGPYEEDNYNQLIARLLTERPPSLGAVCAQLPADVVAAVDGALEPDRARRYRDARAFLATLLSVPSLQAEPWLLALRSSYRADLEAAVVSEQARGSVVPPAENARSSRRGEAHSTTAGTATTELPTRPLTRNGPRTAVVVVLGATLLGVAGLGAALRATRQEPRPEVRVLQREPLAPAVDATAAPSATAIAQPAPGATAQANTFAVQLTVHPESATIELDGERIVGSVLARSFALDGREHVLRVSAQGYEGRVVSFRDAPPPEEIELEPSRPTRLRGATAATRESGAHVGARASAMPASTGAQTPAAPVARPASPEATAAAERPIEPAAPSRPHRPPINGAPVLGM